MGKNNTEELQKKINFFKFMGLKIDIFYSISCPNIIIKENNNILQFINQKEMNWYIDDKMKYYKKKLENDLLNEKGIFSNDTI